MFKTISSQIRKFYNDYKLAIQGMFAHDPTRTAQLAKAQGYTEYGIFKKMMLAHLDKDPGDAVVSTRAMQKAWKEVWHEHRTKEVRDQEHLEQFLSTVYGSKQDARKYLGVRSLKGITLDGLIINGTQNTKIVKNKYGKKIGWIVESRDETNYKWSFRTSLPN